MIIETYNLSSLSMKYRQTVGASRLLSSDRDESIPAESMADNGHRLKKKDYSGRDLPDFCKEGQEIIPYNDRTLTT
jgi:hypothetical protein